jgi:hypothetical protein
VARGIAAAVALAGCLKAALLVVGAALVAPMYAFEGGSTRVAVAIALAYGVVAATFVVSGGLLAFAIWHIDLTVAAMIDVRDELRRRLLRRDP